MIKMLLPVTLPPVSPLSGFYLACSGTRVNQLFITVRWLTKDVVIQPPCPPLRQFWFDPSFAPGSATARANAPRFSLVVILNDGRTATPQDHDENRARTIIGNILV